MTWNYRILAQKNSDDNINYAVHEVYYNENKEIEYWSESPITLHAESSEELIMMKDRYLLAFTKPILNEENLKQQLQNK